jgi:hypothetical protein
VPDVVNNRYILTDGTIDRPPAFFFCATGAAYSLIGMAGIPAGCPAALNFNGPF